MLPFGSVHPFSEMASLHSPSEPQALASTVYPRAASSSVRSHFKGLAVAGASQERPVVLTLYTVTPVVTTLGIIVTTNEVGESASIWSLPGAMQTIIVLNNSFHQDGSSVLVAYLNI